MKNNQEISNCKNCGNCKKKEKEQLAIKQCEHEWNETTSNGDAYRFFVCKHCDSTQNYVPFEADNCTDIKNHISPNTKVIEK